ncbi:MAG: helix-turn-helix domain-containing protein, partial [Bacteroidota bacterium]|nr:helix-turn-helix domain-containing protein [Bacteroidota bacterium]
PKHPYFYNMQNTDNNVICFIAHNSVVDIHYHTCFQIVVSFQSTFNCLIEGNEYGNMKGFIINQTIKHSCKAQDTSVFVYLIDAESYLGWQLKEMLSGKAFLDIESLLTKHQLQQLIVQCNRASSIKEMKIVADDLLENILPTQAEQKNKIMDDRISKVMEYIEHNLDNPISLDDISKQIFLSPERARHLFVQQTGTPFSQYILWKRIKNIITAVLKNNIPIVNAAIQAGFTDQAHFSRIFKRMFGASAKPLLKNSRFVQFLTPEV